MVQGFQDFWVAGSRIYLKRDAIETVSQPWTDIGVIETANPTQETTKIELFDGDGGVKVLVDERVTEINESYDVEVRNLSLSNLALFFKGKAPVEFTQTVEHKAVLHETFEGHLVKVHDDDADETNLFALSAISGVLSAPVSAGVLSTAVITAMDASSKTITTSVDISAGLTPGEPIVVTGDGLANILNARTYTVASVVATVITVNEDILTDEVAITGTLIYKAAADTGTVFEQDVDWEVVSTDRGLLRIIDGGAIVAASAVVAFSTAALTGTRIFNPQDGGEVQGTMLLVWGRSNNAEQTVREARVSVTPSAGNIQIDDFSSVTLTFRVISVLTSDVPAGRMLHFKGAVPAKS